MAYLRDQMCNYPLLFSPITKISELFFILNETICKLSQLYEPILYFIFVLIYVLALNSHF
jgi:hypothetical protein